MIEMLPPDTSPCSKSRKRYKKRKFASQEGGDAWDDGGDSYGYGDSMGGYASSGYASSGKGVMCVE